VLTPAFTRLMGDLTTALNLGPNDTGACRYTNPDGCITCTQDECTELGGQFFPGTIC
jgi:hypothetical protein